MKEKKINVDKWLFSSLLKGCLPLYKTNVVLFNDNAGLFFFKCYLRRYGLLFLRVNSTPTQMPAWQVSALTETQCSHCKGRWADLKKLSQWQQERIQLAFSPRLPSTPVFCIYNRLSAEALGYGGWNGQLTGFAKEGGWENREREREKKDKNPLWFY